MKWILNFYYVFILLSSRIVTNEWKSW